MQPPGQGARGRGRPRKIRKTLNPEDEDAYLKSQTTPRRSDRSNKYQGEASSSRVPDEQEKAQPSHEQPHVDEDDPFGAVKVTDVRAYFDRLKFNRNQKYFHPLGEDEEPILIGVMNHKGGVGKTTLACELGASCSEAGYLTLIIDADPQQNTTKYFMKVPVKKEDIKHQFEAAQVSGDEADLDAAAALLDMADQRAAGAKLPALSAGVKKLRHTMPSFSPAALRKIAAQVEAVRQGASPTNIFDQFVQPFYAKGRDGNPFDPRHGELTTYHLREAKHQKNTAACTQSLLLLLPGALNFQDGEKFLQPDELANCSVRKNKQNELEYWLYFNTKLRYFAKKNGIRFVIIDCPPANSSLNQMIISSCDYVASPARSDEFSINAVWNMIKENGLLDNWFQDQESIYKLLQEAEEKASWWSDSKGRYVANRRTYLLPFLGLAFGTRGESINEADALGFGKIAALADGPGVAAKVKERYARADIEAFETCQEFNDAFLGSSASPMIQPLHRNLTPTTLHRAMIQCQPLLVSAEPAIREYLRHQQRSIIDFILKHHRQHRE